MAGNKEDDIPGFFKDPKTGKYYREKPGDVGNSSLEKLKADRATESKGNMTTPKTKITGLPQFLRQRELGAIGGGVHSQTEYWKMKTHTKVLIEDRSLRSVQPHSIETVEFLSGWDRSVYGKWGIGSDKHVVGELIYLNVPDHRPAEFRECNNIVDMCRGPVDTIICLYSNHPNLDIRKVGFFEFLEKSITTHPMCFSNENMFDSFAFYTCCAMQPGYTYAVGGDKKILLFEIFRVVNVLPMTGKVYTLSFHEPSNTLISGDHQGILYLNDTRIRRPGEAAIKISNLGLIDSLLVDANRAIVADAENTLVMADFRNKKIVTTFNGHQHTVKKRHFSFANNMLCGTGKDNVIRIWSVYGGNPIYHIKPLIKAENNIRGWLHETGSKTYLDYFEADNHKVFEL